MNEAALKGETQSAARRKVRVLVVDDSALVRKLLPAILESDPGIEVVGTAPDPYVARERIKQLNPDVLTLDVEMPRMDGLSFLRNLMRLRPMPVVMVSSLTEVGAEITLDALEIGAVDFVAKPKVDLAHELEHYSREICEKVKTAARVRPGVRVAPSPSTAAVTARHSADAVLPRAPARHFRTTDRLLAIGASTGGTEAIKEVLQALPADAPGTEIVQHIPLAFSESFARRMNSISALTVCHAAHGQQIVPGHAYIAPGDQHLMVVRSGARWHCELSSAPPVNRHRPSVDVLFRSVAQHAGRNAVGVILTGMGDDGAAGMVEMHEAGAPTVVQDEASSVVWGMPGAAGKAGGVDQVLPLARIAAAVDELLRR